MKRLSVGTYYGSKNKHLDFILPLLPVTPIYVEPFGGSAAVLLNRPRSGREIYNDLYEPVANLVRIVRDGQPALQRALRLTPHSRSEFLSTYPEMGGGEPGVGMARDMVIRMLQGVGSVAASRRTRAGWKRDTHPDHASFRWDVLTERYEAASRRLQEVEIENRDALDAVREHDSPETLFYLDPPYVLSVRSGHEGYANELPDDGQRALADVLNGIRGLASVSGYESPLYEDLYPASKGWSKRIGSAKELKPNPGADIVVRAEALWINYG